MATPLRTEQDWARQHPVPESTEEDMLLSLWNYPVAKSDLAPEHRAALDRFLKEALEGAKLGGGVVPSKTEICLTGHASNTGDDAANETLSRQRAEKVARYLLSQGVTRQQMHVDWAGANDPVDRGNSGLAAARNRRVDVLKFTPSEPERRPPVDIIEPPSAPSGRAPTFKLPPPQMSTATIEDTVTVDYPRRVTPWYVISGKIDIIVKLKATDGGDGFALGMKTTPDGKVGIKADGEIAKHIKSKFSVDVDPDKRTANVKLGAELTDKPFTPEVGIQFRPDFFYITLATEPIELLEFEVASTRFTGTMQSKGTLNFAPGPSALLVASPIIVALLILGLTVYGIDAAESEQTRVARLWAAREGVAARIAWELAGNDAKAAFDARRLEWRKASAAMEAEFNAGVNEINRLLQTPEERNVWNREWKKKYAADNTADFQTLFGRVFDNVGGHESEGTLADAVARAIAE